MVSIPHLSWNHSIFSIAAVCVNRCARAPSATNVNYAVSLRLVHYRPANDSAHWIWNLAEEHFPGATQILDWYHAATYVWQAAHALYGQDSDDAKRWARQHLDLLWDGQVATVIAHLEATASPKAPVNDTLTYFRNNQHRMHYASYRARGLQIGSGTIESGCKHVIAQRLKQAGMIWSPDGARAVAKLRTRLKSRRWDETLALRPPPHRSYLRLAA